MPSGRPKSSKTELYPEVEEVLANKASTTWNVLASHATVILVSRPILAAGSPSEGYIFTAYHGQLRAPTHSHDQPHPVTKRPKNTPLAA